MMRPSVQAAWPAIFLLSAAGCFQSPPPPSQGAAAPDWQPAHPSITSPAPGEPAEVARLIGLGVFRKADPQAVAEVIWSAGHGLVSFLITKPGFPWSPRETLVATMAEAICRGFSAGEGPVRA